MNKEPEQKVYVDPGEGYSSENKWEVAYQILMDYFEDLPEETQQEVDKRLKAVDL
jgi:hypothetical protein|tara:strand:+ start:278 stop:442 length:165 start_codon:yes stop_codon:yes gene_type:complete